MSARPDRALLRTAVLAMLTVIAAGAFVVRIPAVMQPLGIDQGLFASAARALSHGARLYRDVWDQKPPGVFLSYLATFKVFGWTPAAIAGLDLIVSAFTTWMMFLAARRLAGAPLGATTAALYAALTMPGWLYRYGGFLERSVAETFIAALVACGAWCAVRLREQAASSSRAACLGIVTGAAIVFKPNAGLYLPALLAWLYLYGEKETRRRAIGIAVLSAAVAPAVTVFWLWREGVLPDARVALIDFNRFYVAESLSGRVVGLDFAKAVWLRFKTDPLWGAGGIGALLAMWELARARRLDPVAGLAMAWGGAAALVIAINGAYLFNSYFVQALPPLALLTAWGLMRAGRSRLHTAAAVAAIAVMAIPLVRKNYPVKVWDAAWSDLQQWRGGRDRMAYLERFGGYGTGGGYSARANQELADFIRARTSEGDLIYQFGINSAGVYFDADRLMANRFLRVNDFVPAAFPRSGFDLAAVARELAARRPRYLIFERLPGAARMPTAVNGLPHAPELADLLREYDRETQLEDYTVYRRRN